MVSIRGRKRAFQKNKGKGQQSGAWHSYTFNKVHDAFCSAAAESSFIMYYILPSFSSRRLLCERRKVKKPPCSDMAATRADTEMAFSSCSFVVCVGTLEIVEREKRVLVLILGDSDHIKRSLARYIPPSSPSSLLDILSKHSTRSKFINWTALD